jgi:hypothetical protein
MVPRRGLEPPPPCEDQHLKLACLPISPPGQEMSGYYTEARNLLIESIFVNGCVTLPSMFLNPFSKEVLLNGKTPQSP